MYLHTKGNLITKGINHYNILFTGSYVKCAEKVPFTEHSSILKQHPTKNCNNFDIDADHKSEIKVLKVLRSVK